MTPDELLKEYRVLKSILSGQKHAERYIRFYDLVINNQDSLLTLVFSGKVNNQNELCELITFGTRGGTGLETNHHWADFMGKVWARHTELPNLVASYVNWYADLWRITEVIE
jgi:hypothetical protein